MTRTLVTLGYHFGELEWGRIVRDTYYQTGLKEGRRVHFHEIRSSDVETSYPCDSSLREVQGVIRDGRFDLWIDVHCGLGDPNILLVYKTDDKGRLERAKRIPDVKVGNFRKIPPRDRSYIERNFAFADAFMHQDDYKQNTGSFLSGLERTIHFINDIHDIQS